MDLRRTALCLAASLLPLAHAQRGPAAPDDAPVSAVLGPRAPDGAMGGLIPSADPAWRPGMPVDAREVTGKLQPPPVLVSPVLGPVDEDGVTGGTFPTAMRARQQQQGH
ncbi:hypothetical protein H8N03_20980 [Ramlibacter sp. USB13]|uniref:Uncharacterized protein n=1 Tax=Ramlibacter cellulosilyticus TaxID=2764187 RepID=A0A923MU44_9BURK|nr:hypothetical protein [Ramlibacter cellulosilyticus]MBC5785435.1 hypothetical protein [Ramlibacter cellulosilyticus]